MSRLWPDALHAGLFPGHCWLAKKKGKRDLLASFAAPASAAGVLTGLHECIIQSTDKRKLHGKLSITVSDSIATIVPLPWQDGLNSEAELLGYAQLCFEKQGHDVRANWVTRVEYPRYAKPGLAYALPRDWMESVQGELEGHGLRLETVLPISAQVFCSGLGSSRHGLSIILLFESTQHCAIAFRDGALIARDVEPFAQTVDATCRRLLARVFANHNQSATVPPAITWWSSMGVEFPKQALEAYAPDLIPSFLSEKVWP